MQELKLPAVIESIPKLTAWMDEALEKLDCPMKAQMQLDVAMDEIFSNIARYAYPDQNGAAAVRMDFDEITRLFSLEFRDQGIPFNPLEQAEPDTALGVEARGIGGLGIFLVRKTMDEVSYQYTDGSNILCLKKRI